uniref:Uncharacterized protein n=1 Tax=Physcomitrium patens TaxID=3218 RepID=A0A7I4CEC7_PHYPA
MAQQAFHYELGRPSPCRIIRRSHPRLAILVVATGAGSKIDNIAVQWNALFSTIICNTPAVIADHNIIFVRYQLAQWHALIAHKTTGSCTSQKIVIANSRQVLANYFSSRVEEQIDPLLVHQIRVLRPSGLKQKFRKQLGEAVALDLIRKRTPAREFILQENQGCA